MKRILLASASILAFAGAAAADVTFGGDATLGFNEDNGIEPRDLNSDGTPDDGFFWEVNLGVTLTQEINNGLTAAASFTLNVVDEDADAGAGGDGSSVDVDDDFLLSLTTENGGLFFGDITFAAESKWDSAGDMRADDFSEADGETVLRGDTIFRGIDASLSAVVADEDNNTPDEDNLDQFALGARGSIARFTYALAYQEESEASDGSTGDYDPEAGNDDFSVDEVFGVSVGSTFAGADVQVAYAQNNTDEDSSLGFEASYPVGPVTLGAFYVIEKNEAGLFDGGFDDVENGYGVSADYASGPLTVSAFYSLEDDDNDIDDAELDTDFENDGDDDDENTNYGLEVGFDSGAGIELYAGYVQEDGGYVGVEYDLGNGSRLIASYADEDEEGAREYEAGTTVAVNFQF